jgi:hypothetical protein
LARVSDDVQASPWPNAEYRQDGAPKTQTEPESPARFAPLPAALTKPKGVASWTTSLKDHLYRNHKLELWKYDELKLVSKPGESEGDFRSRLAHVARERRDAAVEKLELRYASKLAAVKEQVRKAELRLATEKSQSSQQTISAAVSLGASMLGALLGRKVTSTANVNRAGSAIRAATRAAKEHGDIGQAETTVEGLQRKLADLEAEFNAEAAELQTAARPEVFELRTVQIRPRKSEIAVERVVLVWVPEST